MALASIVKFFSICKSFQFIPFENTGFWSFFENISVFTCKRGVWGGILASGIHLKAEIKCLISMKAQPVCVVRSMHTR